MTKQLNSLIFSEKQIRIKLLSPKTNNNNNNLVLMTSSPALSFFSPQDQESLSAGLHGYGSYGEKCLLERKLALCPFGSVPTLQFGSVRCSSVQFSSVQFSSVQFSSCFFLNSESFINITNLNIQLHDKSIAMNISLFNKLKK